MKDKDKYHGLKPEKGRSQDRNLRNLVGRKVSVKGTIINQWEKQHKDGRNFVQITLRPALINGSIELDHLNLFVELQKNHKNPILDGTEFRCVSTVEKYQRRNKTTGTFYTNYGVTEIRKRYYLEAIEQAQAQKELLLANQAHTLADKLKEFWCRFVDFKFPPNEIFDVSNLFDNQNKNPKEGKLKPTISAKHHNFHTMEALLKDIQVELEE
ncbi:hypothetical protein [Lactococcus kimchii]|uniref:hypothetical protein n=1 Tax=Lactococcus sp. S-13 TaxID=2507158 RepID=UPI001023B76E|nr:hypothetical protein [Lactococcus sp. S-13]RZI48728.1 hypothetical protein EQJ87_04260 [Lactococcus sp. S-13]